MPSTYPSFRHSVPWLILLLEAVFIVLSYFLDSIVDAHFPYPDLQDVSHMLIFGFGFFLTFLKRYSFSSTGFSLLIVILGVQCSILMEHVSVLLTEISLSGIPGAAMSTKQEWL